MTMPDERTRAAVYAGAFLRDLLDPRVTPTVPQEVRDTAKWLLRWCVHLRSRWPPAVWHQCLRWWSRCNEACRWDWWLLATTRLFRLCGATPSVSCRGVRDPRSMEAPPW